MGLNRDWMKENQPTPEELAQYAGSFWEGYKLGFLAALLDSEGAIVVHGRNNKLPHIELIISNTNREFLLKAQRLIGGHVRIQRKLPPNHRPVYNLWVSRMEEVLRILKRLRPFLTVKRIQCDAAIEFLSSRIESHRGRLRNCIRDEQGRIFGTPTNPITETERRVIQRICAANSRGKHSEQILRDLNTGTLWPVFS